MQRLRLVQNGTLLSSILTDSAGSYTVSGLSPGSYSVQAQAPNFQSLTRGALVAVNQTTTLNMSLTPSPGGISGTIINASNSSPIASAAITVLKDATTVATIFTDTSGNFSINNLAPGAYTMQVQATNFQSVIRGVIVQANLTTLANVALVLSPGTIMGTIISQSTGDPIFGVAVSVESNGSIVGSTYTDDLGNYQIIGLAPGAYTVQAQAATYQNAVVGAIVNANQNTDVDFSLVLSPGSISGTVIDRVTASPVAGATVKVERDGTQVGIAITDTNGDYMLSGLALGSYVIQISADNYQTFVQGAMVIANQNTDIDVGLVSSPGSISGVVTDQTTGDPIASATVELEINGAVTSFAVTDDEGKYLIVGIAPGSYALQTKAENYQDGVLGAIVSPNQNTVVNFSLLPSPGSISGTVTSAIGGNSIVSAVVALNGSGTVVSTAVTDATGGYLITGVAPGTYTIQARAENYQTILKGVTVLANATTTVDFALEASPGDIAGTVTNEITGEPIVGASVQVQLLSNFTILTNASVSSVGFFTTLTDAQGNYNLRGIPPGSYSIQADAANFQHQVKGVIVEPNQTSIANFELAESPGSIIGTVSRAGSGDFIASATVTLEVNGTIVASAVTDALGNFLINGIAPGSYTIQARAENHQSQVIGVIIAPNEESTTSFTLAQDPGSVSGTVTSELSGLPVVGATVDIESNGTVLQTVLTDDNGYFIVTGLAEGTYSVQAQAKDFQSALSGVNIQPNQNAVVDFALVPNPGAISGTVISELTGNPIAGASVELHRDGVGLTVALTDSAGNYLITGIAPGSYNVQAVAADFQHEVLGIIVEPNVTAVVDFSLEPNPITISGTVINEATGLPVAGAVIEIQTGNNATGEEAGIFTTLIFTTQTDADGNYVIEGIAPGNYIISAQASDFQHEIKGVVGEVEQPNIVNFRLVPSPGSISGTVVSEGGGNPVAAIVSVLDFSGAIISSVPTDPSGAFSLTGLAPGSYTLRTQAQDFETKVTGVMVVANQNTVADFALAASPGNVFGTVTDFAVNPIAGTTIVIESAGAVLATTLSLADGSFIIDGLAPGTYTIQVKAENYQAVLQGLTIVANLGTEVDFVLAENPGEIAGTVSDALSGDSIPGAVVALDIGGTIIASAHVEEDGSYRISGLAPGSYTIQARAVDYQSKIHGVIVSPSETSFVHFVLESSPGTVTGTVTNASTGDPIEGASIEIQVSSLSLEGSTSLRLMTVFNALTDAGGNYSISGLAPGTYSIQAQADGFQTRIQGIIVLADETSVADFALLASPGSIEGTITSDASGDPVVGALVEIEQNGSVIASNFSDALGKYTVSGIAPGNYTIQVHANNFQSVFHGVTVQANQTTVVDFALLSDAGSISGTVTNLANEPIAGARIELEVSGTLVAEAVTDNNGKFLITGVAPGAYTIQAKANQFQTAVSGVIVVALETAQVTFSLASNPGSVTGIITDAQTGAPLTGSVVALDLNGTIIASEFTDSTGSYLISGLAPGSYTIQIQAPNYQTVIQGVIVQADATATANFSLAPNPGSISGTITDANTLLPIVGAVVAVDLSGNQISAGLTDPDGHYIINGIAPGTYTIKAEALGYQIVTQGVAVVANQNTTLDFALLAETGTLEGTVTASNNNAPFAGVYVEVSVSGTKLADALTDEQGKYVINGLAPGSYSVQATANEYQHAIAGATIINAQTTIVDFALQSSPGSISGKITSDVTSEPIAGASVDLEEGGVVIVSALTDASGNYSITGIAPGAYVLKVHALNFESKIQGVVVVANQNSEENFVLASNPGSVSGTVTSDSGGNPIVGARVEIAVNATALNSVFTDQLGNYVLSGLAPGTYTIKVEAEGFAHIIQGVMIDANQNKVIDFALLANPGSIEGSITEAGNGNPITGAIVALNASGSTIFTVFTDSVGHYEITGIGPGAYLIQAQAAGFETTQIGVIVVAGQTSTADISLSASPGSVSGTVTNATTGALIAGANVIVERNGMTVSSTHTDNQGRYLISGLAPGSYTMNAQANDHETQVIGVIIVAHETSTVNFSLSESPGSISGTVTRADNNAPIPGAIVAVDLSGSIVANLLTDQLGNYLINGVAPGTYIIQAHAADFEIQTQGVVVVAHQNTVVNFSLNANPGSIIGAVTDANNVAIAGALIKIESNGTTIAAKLTDATGNYQLLNLAPGTYNIHAQAEGFETAVQGTIVVANQTSVVDFALSASPGSIEGIVTSAATGEPIASATIDLVVNNAVLITKITNAEGRYLMEGVSPGAYFLRVHADGFVTESEGVIVQANATKVADFALESSPGVVVGTVKSTNSSAPLTGALVQIQQNGFGVKSAFTDSDGNYRFEGLAPGPYGVKASADGFETAFQTVIVTANGSATLDFSLSASPGSVFGRVVSLSSQDALIGAVVEIQRNGSVIATAHTDNDGKYVINGLASGAYVISASADGYQSDIHALNVAPNGAEEINFALAQDAGTIVGKVLNLNTLEPVAGAVVEVLLSNSSVQLYDNAGCNTILFTQLTDAQGNYVITGVPPGVYDITARANDFQSTVKSVIVRANETSEVFFFLEENPGAISGTVRNVNGNTPIANALVEVSANNSVVLSTFTDAQGSYVITGVAPGNYVVSAKALNHQSAFQEITISSGQTTTVDFLLGENPGSITGTVNDAGLNTAIVGARVEIYKGDLVVATVLTDAQGNYTVPGLAPGNYVVHVTADSYQNQTTEALVLANQSTIVDFSLASNPGRIAGTLTNVRNGEPLEGVIIELRRDGALLFVTRSDSAGGFHIDGLSPGTYSIRLTLQGFGEVTLTVVVDAGGTSVVSVELTRLTSTARGGRGGGTLWTYPIMFPPPPEKIDLPFEPNPAEDIDVIERAPRAEDAPLEVGDELVNQPEHNPPSLEEGGCSLKSSENVHGLLFALLFIVHAWRRRNAKKTIG